MTSDSFINANMRIKITKANKTKNPKYCYLGFLYLKIGTDILSRLFTSTICADELNFSVRNGKR